jgi:hypothetical protein
MNAAQSTPKTMTIHTTLFDMLAAMQDEADAGQVDIQNTDDQIVATVAAWMQSGRVALRHANPVRSAA